VTLSGDIRGHLSVSAGSVVINDKESRTTSTRVKKLVTQSFSSQR